jgi:TonB-linked SusC/RagA family outer membrane protein
MYKERFLQLMLAAGFSIGTVYAQTPQTSSPSATVTSNTIKGKVVDEGGEPLIGAQIRWKGTKTATITDINGEYSIARDAQSSTLVVSYIGYRNTETNVTSTQTSANVKMNDDAQNLDEVVAVGYGIQKKSSLTGSVETIKAEDLLMMPTTSLDQAITGQVAGLQVMQSTGDPSTAKETSIHIRGIDNSPLLVIDGVPRFGTNTSDGEMRLSDLNPDDVESITILKDAAAAAVYGSRAANGVILVTTKHAKGDKKVQISYRGQYNVQQATKMPDFVDAYNFAELFNRAVDNTPGTTIEKYTDEQLEQIKNHSNPNVYGDEDLSDYLKKTAFSTTHSISANGGSDLINYYLSFGYADSQGLYSGIGKQRLNYMGKIDAKLTKGLTLSVGYTGSNSNSKNSSYSTLTSIYEYSPLQVLRFTNGDLASIDGSNPMIDVNGLGGYIKDKSKMSTITVNLNWEIPWVKGLSAYVRGTFDDNYSIESTFDKPVTLYNYDAAKDSYSEDANTVYPTAKVSLKEDDSYFQSQLYEAGVNYNRTFSGKHDVEGTLVTNYQRTHNQYMNGTNADKSIYPETMGTAQTAVLTGNEDRNQRASLIGRAHYGYANKYFGEFSFRVDGSNNFAPSKRWGFFPSFSGAWVVSNEDFFRAWKQKIISNLKFRASTGWLGNDGVADSYSYLKTYIESTNRGYGIGGNFTPGLMLSTGGYPNPDLTWGKTHDWNFATDIGFWGGRLGITFEYYIRYETDKITSVPDYLYPPSTGVEGNVPNMNFAKLKAWGWDLTINHRNTIGKLKYNVGVTLSKNQDEYLDFGDESSQLPNLRRKGTSSMVWTMYQADGLFKSQEEINNYKVNQDGQGNATLAPGDIKYVDQNGDHVIDANDRIYVKNSSYPDLDLGVRLGVSYKGFFINALFQGEFGYKQNISEYYTLNNSTLQKFQKYHLTETWTKDNPDARYPRIKFATTNDNNRKASTFWIQDCNFLRLKMLNIGYALPAHLVKSCGLTSASLAFQASNLFTITDLDIDMDPESLRGYPVQKSYGVTLNLGF